MVKTGGAPRSETDKTAPHKNQNSNYPANPTLSPRAVQATREIPTTPKQNQHHKKSSQSPFPHNTVQEYPIPTR